MNVQLSEGTYVVAVSGGVDSMVLLHTLYATYKNNKAYTFIVAHFNHGIRKESFKDAELVKAVTCKYGFFYEYAEGNLGSNTSENTARVARYAFLRNVTYLHKAAAILTAHHQDDMLETILLHVARGTGRKGLAPMRGYSDIQRPLLGYTKASLVAYAVKHKLHWNEDATNEMIVYTRNALRSVLKSRLRSSQRKSLVNMYTRMLEANKEADLLVKELYLFVSSNNKEVIRSRFVLLGHDVSCEVMYEWLLANGQENITKQLIERTVHAAKTLAVGKKIDLGGGNVLQSCKNVVKFCKNV